jgi:hypothetical protein
MPDVLGSQPQNVPTRKAPTIPRGERRCSSQFADEGSLFVRGPELRKISAYVWERFRRTRESESAIVRKIIGVEGPEHIRGVRNASRTARPRGEPRPPCNLETALPGLLAGGDCRSGAP